MSFPALNADLNLIIAGGMSGGSVMTQLLHCTMSDIIKGSVNAVGVPMATQWPQTITVDATRSAAATMVLKQAQVDYAKKVLTDLEKNKTISPVAGLKNAPVYIYTGANDIILPTPNQESQTMIYRDLGAKIIAHEIDANAGH